MKIHEAKILSSLSMIGIATVLLAGCSTSQVATAFGPGSLVTNGHSEAMSKTPSKTSKGLGMMGGGMALGGWPGISGPGEEKSFGVLTFERPKGYRVRSVIGKDGGSFANITNTPYYVQSMLIVSGFGAGAPECIPQISYLTVGDSGTVRFTRKNKDLLARITLRTLSGKIAPKGVTVKKEKAACDHKGEKARNVSETIQTNVVPVTPGKETRVKIGTTTITVSLDKDFPVEKVPAFPAYSPIENDFGSPFLRGGMMGGGLGAGMMGGNGVGMALHGHPGALLAGRR